MHIADITETELSSWQNYKEWDSPFHLLFIPEGLNGWSEALTAGLAVKTAKPLS